MLSTIFSTIFINPMLNILVFLYSVTGSLGVSIILLTFIIRVILTPLMLPGIKSAKKQRELKPELDKIKKKFKNDKKKQAEAQMELFKKHGLNPASGCLAQIPTFVAIIALYQVIQRISSSVDLLQLNQFIYFDSIKFTTSHVNTHFLYFDLTKPEGAPYLLAILVGVLQFFSTKLMMGFTKKGEEIAKRTPDKVDDLAYNMQEQMLYIAPIMMFAVSISLPSGVVLYLLATTVFSTVQNYFVFGKGFEVKNKKNKL